MGWIKSEEGQKRRAKFDREYKEEMSKEKLKPCPFCNGEATVIQCILKGSYTYGVTCIMCEASVPCKYTNRKTAVRAWNRRAYENDNVHL